MIQAIIIAAGWGSRLYPITDVVPKIMIPIGIDEKPLAEHILNHCIEHGIFDFLFCLNRRSGKQVMNYFRDGRFDVNIEYSFSDIPRGTAGELRLAWENDLISVPSLIYYGDTLCSTNLTEMFLLHEEKKANITIVVNDEIRIPTGYIEDIDGEIVRIVEKPTLSEIGSSGNKKAGGILPIFYVQNEELFSVFAQEGLDLVSDVFPMMMKEYKINIYHDTDPFLDLGNWKNYERAKNWI